MKRTNTRRQFLAGSLAVAGPWPLCAAAGKLRAGAATSNITPSLGCSLAGGMTDRIGTEVHDELHVRSVVLDNGSTKLAIAVVDSCAVPRSVIDPAKEQIQSSAGIPIANIL